MNSHLKFRMSVEEHNIKTRKRVSMRGRLTRPRVELVFPAFSESKRVSSETSRIAVTLLIYIGPERIFELSTIVCCLTRLQ